MKIYISADIEGVTGVTHWDETEIGKPDYGVFREQMTAEVVAACEAATAAGASEIWIKDAHDTGRNLIAAKLPSGARLVRGWSGHPFSMVQELDGTFAALILIGYHARAGSAASPLAHTLTGVLAYIKVNDRYASELLLHGYAAALVGVPIVFVSGDAGVCEEARSLSPEIVTFPVKHGVGGTTVNVHPERAIQGIRDGVRQALQGDLTRCRFPLPGRFAVEVGYKDHAKAYRASFYPGASLSGPSSVSFETGDYFEVLRFLLFVT
ncbi:MAG: M55 family metallopeptidase [Candidatus Bipolaricaulota bacterium]